MDEISKSVAHNVKTGQYFIDARNWYNQKYLDPVAERSLLVLIFVITSIAFCVVLYTFNALFPLRREVPFVIKVEDSIDYYSTIKPLIKTSEQPQDALTTYLLENYVTTYESYSFQDVESLEARIQNSSAKQVFKAYTNRMSTTNPESPLLLYQKAATITVKILSTTITRNESEIDKAAIIFQTTVNDRLKGTKTTSVASADITFIMSDINKVSTKKEPLEFIVTDYHVRHIK